MFDHGNLMPSYTDDVFRYLVNAQPPEYADGEVEAPTGWFGILEKPSRQEIAHAVSITGSPRAGEAGVFGASASYGFRVNSDGLIWVYEYTDDDPQSDESVYYDFDRAVDEYNAWCNAVADPEDDPNDNRKSSIQPRNLPGQWGPWGPDGRQGD